MSLAPDPQCNLQPDSQCTACISRGQSLGLLVTAEAGLFSVVAVLFLFGKISRKVLRNVRNPPADGWRFFKSPLDVYMLSLFVSDFIQGLGLFFNVRWAARGIVSCGIYCTSQGVIQQLGEATGAMATLAIAVHTFLIIFFRKGSKQIKLASGFVCIIWLYVIIFIIVNGAKHNKGDDEYYTPTPYWCWVANRFDHERIAGEYFWLWLTAFVSLALYVPLFLCLRGNISVEGKKGWQIRFHRRPDMKPRVTNINRSPGFDVGHDTPQASQHPARSALIMLVYPVCYVVLVLPLSIARWISFGSKGTVPSAATFSVTSIFGLSGLVNVILLIMTRPGLLLLSDPPKASPEASL